MVEYGEYKGSKVIILKRRDNDDFPFSFGVAKAKLVLKHLEEIRQFVESNSSSR